MEGDKCGQILDASSLPSHLKTQHKIFQMAVLGEEYLEDHPTRTFKAHQSVDGSVRCPVTGCVDKASSVRPVLSLQPSQTDEPPDWFRSYVDHLHTEDVLSLLS